MEKIWITKNGDEIEYKKLKDDHLLNIIKFVKKRAKEMDGEIIDGGFGWDNDDCWYEEGDEQDWLDKFDYKGLRAEAKRRKIKIVY